MMTINLYNNLIDTVSLTYYSAMSRCQFGTLLNKSNGGWYTRRVSNYRIYKVWFRWHHFSLFFEYIKRCMVQSQVYVF